MLNCEVMGKFILTLVRVVIVEITVVLLRYSPKFSEDITSYLGQSDASTVSGFSKPGTSGTSKYSSLSSSGSGFQHGGRFSSQFGKITKRFSSDLQETVEHKNKGDESKGKFSG